MILEHTVRNLTVACKLTDLAEFVWHASFICSENEEIAISKNDI